MIWYASNNPNGFVTGKTFSVDKPCVTIMAAGMGGDSYGHWEFIDDGSPEAPTKPSLKPPYRVPSMVDIAVFPQNGFTVASCFSGCGGSSLGYRMAGFRVVWANEFISAARDTYAANAPTTFIDHRDIRIVTGSDIATSTGIAIGDLDVLDGSPPCASFSTAGKLAEHWGQIKAYSDTRQRTDDLFFEYARLVSEVQPRVFVAENVSGLVKGVAKGTFKQVLAAFKSLGYRVEARLLDAQWLGVPQQRQRLIFIGVRGDLGMSPVFPAPLPYRYSVRDALPHLVRQGDNAGFGGGSMRSTAVHPSPTIGSTPHTGNGRYPPSVVEEEVGIGTYKGQRSFYVPAPSVLTHGRPHTTSELTIATADTRRRFTIAELKRICAFPDDFILTGTYAQQWERLGRAVPPVMMAAIATSIRDEILIPLRATSEERQSA